MIVLDSECDKVDGCGADSPQGRVAGGGSRGQPDASCTIAICHNPRFSSGDEHGNDRTMARFWDPLYAAGVDVIVNGHDHDYERFAPQDPRGTRGPRARHPAVRRRHRRDRAARVQASRSPNSELRVAVAHGVIASPSMPSRYDWAFIPVGRQRVPRHGHGVLPLTRTAPRGLVSRRPPPAALARTPASWRS